MILLPSVVAYSGASAKALPAGTFAEIAENRREMRKRDPIW